MTARLRNLSTNRQLAVDAPENAARDQGRLVQRLDEMFGSLAGAFLERLQRPTTIITSTTSRPVLKFGEMPLVDTVTDNVRLYLPGASPRDQGRRCTFVKRYANNHVTLQSSDGSPINGLYQSLSGLTQTGLHEIWWDGSGWWSKEPMARVRGHDLRRNPVGLWQFGHGSLADSSDNGFDLTVETGTERYAYLTPTLGGFLFDGSTSLWYDVSESKLRITGDMTFQCLWVMHAVVNNAALISHEASGELEAQNSLYLFGTQTYPAWQFFTESGAGVNSSHTGTFGHWVIGQLTHITVTRTSNVVRLYLNGRQHGTASSALTTPTGGSDGRLRIGSSLTTRVSGVMASAALIDSALSSDEIVSDYHHCMGLPFGFLNEVDS